MYKHSLYNLYTVISAAKSLLWALLILTLHLEFHYIYILPRYGLYGEHVSGSNQGQTALMGGVRNLCMLIHGRQGV